MKLLMKDFSRRKVDDALDDLKETFTTLPKNGERNEYKKATDAVNAHYVFAPNATFQRHLFRKMKKEESKTVAQFEVPRSVSRKLSILNTLHHIAEARMRTPITAPTILRQQQQFQY